MPFMVNLLEIDTLGENPAFLAEEVHVTEGMPQLSNGISQEADEHDMKAPAICYVLSLPPQLCYLCHTRSI